MELESERFPVSGRKFADADDKIPRNIVDFRFLINNQIDDSRKILTTASTEEQMNRAEQAVDVLEAMLVDALDDKYRDKLKLVKETHGQAKKLMKKKQYETNHLQLRFMYILRKWELLIESAGRKGFTIKKAVALRL